MFSYSVGHALIVSLAVQERLVSQSPVCQLLVLSPKQLEFFSENVCLWLHHEIFPLLLFL